MLTQNILTVGEIDRAWAGLLSYAHAGTPTLADRCLFGLILDSGARPSEAAMLTWSCIQIDSQEAGFISFASDTTKRGRARQVAMTSRLIRLVLEWRNNGTGANRLEPSDYVFPGKAEKEPMTTRTVQRAVVRCSLHLLGRPLHPYALRHTFATQLLRVSNLRVVQDCLGHKSPSTTQVYAHVQDQDVLHGVQKYEEMTSV
jgi:integrase